jgi:hypothetical protein
MSFGNIVEKGKRYLCSAAALRDGGGDGLMRESSRQGRV